MGKIKLFLLMICAVSSLVLTGCDMVTDLFAQLGKEEEEVQLHIDDMTLVDGEEATLPSEITVGDKTFSVEYAPENDKVTVDGNKITAVSGGKCKINVSADGAFGDFTVTVKERGILSVRNIILEAGETSEIKATLSSKDIKCEVVFTFEGDDIEITDGAVKAITPGTVTTVTATTPYHTVTFTVTVKEDYGTMTVKGPESIYSNYPGKPIEITFSNTQYATDVTFTSSVSNVYVENGLVYATGTFDEPVTATITARSSYHKTTFDVVVSTFFGSHNEEKKVSYYEKNIIANEDNRGGLIFIGDSYFDGYLMDSPPFWSDFYSDYANEKAFLMGISSSGINDWEIVSERIVFPMMPSEIAVHIGFNDIHHSSISPEDLAFRIITLLDSYKEALPDVKVYYFGIEPKKNAFTNDTYRNSSLVNAPKVNKMISDYAKSTDWLVFLDTDPYTYTTSGKNAINQDFYLSVDLSHPTLLAYDNYRKMLNDARGAKTEDSSAEGAGTLSFDISNYGKNENINDTGRYFTDKNGQNLTNNFVVKGKLTVTRINKSNAHIQFRFSQGFRFILWDNDNDGKFAAGYIGGGTVSDKTAGVTEPYDANSTLTLEWAVAVKDGKAYWYLDGVLVGSFDAPTLQYFNIGALQVDVSFADVTVAVKSDDEGAYDAAIVSLGIG